MPDFEDLFNASPNAYVLLDRSLTIVEANNAYLEATGKKRRDILGQYLFDVFPGNPDDPDDPSARRLRTSFERVLSEGEQHSLAFIRYAIPRQTAEGTVFDERYWSATHHPILDDEGEVAYILQHTVDVSALHEEGTARQESAPDPTTDAPWEQVEEGVLQRAQAVQDAYWTLDSERRHLRRLFDQAPGFMAFLRGRDHVFEMANEAYYQMVGHRDILGKPVKEALPEVHGQGFLDLLNQVYETGEAFVGQEMEIELQREPDEPPEDVYVDFVYQPVTKPDGSVTGIFVQGHDVTEQKRTKDELRRHQNQLEELVRERTREVKEQKQALRQAQKLEAVGKLTGGVAHDFNNLLQVIGGNLQFLQRDFADNRSAQRRLEAAASAVDRGAELASQLLAFARRQPLEPRVVNPGRLLKKMRILLRRTMDKSIDIEMLTEDGLWNIEADPNQLENVVLNLAINARDAMDGEGKLTIEADNAALKDGYTEQHPDLQPGNYVCLAVSDTGCGMPPEDVERAFEPFFTTKSEDQGTGLGLSMAYGFVKQTGGHIKIYSEVDEGTTVKIYLPRTLQPAEETASDKVVSPDSIEGGDETILVVEDDAEVRSTVVDMLSDLGYYVLEASDGQKALAVVESGVTIDLLFTDVIMPGPVDSTELARRAQQLVPGLSVLFTSGYTEDAVVHRGRLDPEISLLSKPYSRSELAGEIRRALGTEPRPADSDARPSETSAEPVSPGQAPSPHVLVVEDNRAVQQFAQDAAEELGCGASAVSNAEEALSAFEHEAFDVLFTDVKLPGMTGVELARRLRARHPDLQVIFASGYGSAAEKQYREAIDGAVLLAKPYDVPDLERALERSRL